MLGLALASAKPFLAAETSGVRIGYASSGQGALTREPIAVAAQGSAINILDFRESSNQIRLWLDGDQTSFVTGKSLYIGQTEYAVSSSSFSGGVTQMTWTATDGVMEDGKGYAVDFY